jgi:hypothetical protein
MVGVAGNALSWSSRHPGLPPSQLATFRFTTRRPADSAPTRRTCDSAEYDPTLETSPYAGRARDACCVGFRCESAGRRAGLLTPAGSRVPCRDSAEHTSTLDTSGLSRREASPCTTECQTSRARRVHVPRTSRARPVARLRATVMAHEPPPQRVARAVRCATLATRVGTLSAEYIYIYIYNYK